MSEPAPSLKDQPWLNAPASRAVMAALAAAGGGDCARYVGGCVRNALTGHPIDDVDIATVLRPDQVIAALRAARLKAVPTGVEHGTVTAVSSGQPFEITTLRRDVETDGRRAVVAFTSDWMEDAQRRDFRLNALYADTDGQLFDPTGEGVADALAGRIVFVGDAEMRIAEDALRILRFFRFQAWYGRAEPDAAGLAACARMKDRIAQLSAERITKEWLKLLAADDPRPVVRAMAQAGVLDQILPAGWELTRFERLVALQRAQGFEADALLRLAAFLPDDKAVATGCAKRLRLSNAQADRLIAALAPDGSIEFGDSRQTARALIYRLGDGAFRDQVLLAWAGVGDFAEFWRVLLALAHDWVRPSFPVTGDDVMAAGFAKGPQVGAVLRELEASWIDGDFEEDRGALMTRLREMAQGK